MFTNASPRLVDAKRARANLRGLVIAITEDQIEADPLPHPELPFRLKRESVTSVQENTMAEREHL